MNEIIPAVFRRRAVSTPPSSCGPTSMRTSPSITWAHIGDLHADVADGWRGIERLERIVAELNGLLDRINLFGIAQHAINASPLLGAARR